MRPLYQIIQRVLLAGARLERTNPPAPAVAPARLAPLVAALAERYREFDQRAMRFGNRYRSGYWAIYLLSALAVLCAVLPLALGWDSPGHRLHSLAALWAGSEVVVIGTVSAIYWRGSRAHWQRQWLQARTGAELVGYLPLLAPLLRLDEPTSEANWYLRIFDPGPHVRAADGMGAICHDAEPLAREALQEAWSDAGFVQAYGRWAVQILDHQRHYHQEIALRHHALEHRLHKVTLVLFCLTALAAVVHLTLHSLWLSLVTTFLPALAASLHGALAQSEAHRLQATSHRLVNELRGCVARIQEALGAPEPERIPALRSSIEAGIATLLDEHQDWHMLVRPHHLPLA